MEVTDKTPAPKIVMELRGSAEEFIDLFTALSKVAASTTLTGGELNVARALHDGLMVTRAIWG